MSRAFVIRSIVWIAAVVLASPFLIEALDRRDIVLAVPGLPVTTAEVLFAAVLALAPSGLVLVWRKLRPEADRGVRDEMTPGVQAPGYTAVRCRVDDERDMADQKPVDGRINWRSWAAVNSAGFGLAFLSFIPGMLLMDVFLPAGLTNMGSSPMPEVLDPEALPAWLDPQTYRVWYRMHLGYHVVALAIYGVIVGWFQSRVLRRVVPVLPWVAATATGVVAILCAEIVERHVVVGPHAGPVEPLMISIGGSTLAGLAQWFVLHQQGVIAGRWLAFWIVGVAVGVGVAVTTIIGVQMAVTALLDPPWDNLTVVAQAVAWGLMLLILGSVMGAVAGAFSARALSSSIGRRDIKRPAV